MSDLAITKPNIEELPITDMQMQISRFNSLPFYAQMHFRKKRNLHHRALHQSSLKLHNEKINVFRKNNLKRPIT